MGCGWVDAAGPLGGGLMWARRRAATPCHLPGVLVDWGAVSDNWCVVGDDWGAVHLAVQVGGLLVGLVDGIVDGSDQWLGVVVDTGLM